jgi:hypothetical protein
MNFPGGSLAETDDRRDDVYIPARLKGAAPA